MLPNDITRTATFDEAQELDGFHIIRTNQQPLHPYEFHQHESRSKYDVLSYGISHFSYFYYHRIEINVENSIEEEALRLNLR